MTVGDLIRKLSAFDMSDEIMIVPRFPTSDFDCDDLRDSHVEPVIKTYNGFLFIAANTFIDDDD